MQTETTSLERLADAIRATQSQVRPATYAALERAFADFVEELSDVYEQQERVVAEAGRMGRVLEMLENAVGTPR